MKLGEMTYQLLGHLPGYATESVNTWQRMTARMAGYGLKLNGIRVLEVGCGYAYPYVLLFDSAGTDITGIDIQALSRRHVGAKGYAPLLKTRGTLPTVRRIGRDFLFRMAFDRRLQQASNLVIKPRRAKLARMDAGCMGFADRTFDFIYSSACFEHLEEVPKAAAEIARILKPGGVVEIEVHLFTSMTGGHEPELYNHRPPPPHFQLWGHLLDPNWEAPLFLNRWREHQYRNVLTDQFRIREVMVTSDHGRQYLTSEIVSRLIPAYSFDELATESVLYVLSAKQ